MARAQAPVRTTPRAPIPSARLVLTAVGLAALAVRLALLLRAPAFIIADSENYFLPGYQLAREIGFDLDLRRTPAYPLFIALVVDGLAEDLAALMLAQHALGVGTCLLVAWLGFTLFGAWAGLLAGVLAALASPLLAAEHYVMAEALFIPLLMVALVALGWAIRAPGRWPMFLGGALVGFAALARPIGLVVAVALAPAVLAHVWRAGARPGQALRAALARYLPALGGVALVLLPWMARNAVVHGSFSADGTGGQTLVGRTMRHDRGFSFENPDDLDPARQRARAIMRDGRGGFVSPVRERIKRELGLTDLEANRLMRDLAVEAILRQPGYYLAGTIGNLWRLIQGPPERVRDHWDTRREARNRDEWEGHDEIRHLLGPPSPLQEAQYGQAEVLLSLYQPAGLGPLVPFLALAGLVGLTRSGQRSAALLLGLTALGLLAASAALVAPLPRYRYPAEPLFALFAAGGITTMARWARPLVLRSVRPLLGVGAGRPI